MVQAIERCRRHADTKSASEHIFSLRYLQNRRTARAVRKLLLSDEWNGGAYRDRTGDPLLAKQVLSQLS